MASLATVESMTRAGPQVDVLEDIWQMTLGGLVGFLSGAIAFGFLILGWGPTIAGLLAGYLNGGPSLERSVVGAGACVVSLFFLTVTDALVQLAPVLEAVYPAPNALDHSLFLVIMPQFLLGTIVLPGMVGGWVGGYVKRNPELVERVRRVYRNRT